MAAHQPDLQSGKVKTRKDKIHPVSVPGFLGTNNELGQAIGRMRYDQVVLVLEGLRVEISRQAVSDHKLRRFCLSGHLTMLNADIQKVIDKLLKIFTVCRPFMAHEIQEAAKESKRTKR